MFPISGMLLPNLGIMQTDHSTRLGRPPTRKATCRGGKHPVPKLGLHQ